MPMLTLNFHSQILFPNLQITYPLMQYNQLTGKRILSIDVLRGITILVMIFVNELAGVRDVPAWMKHMPGDADAMSFVDVVFPAFLFIVGMAIPFAINRRLESGDSRFQVQLHILFRTLGLLVLGFFLVNTEGGYDEKAMGISINLWALLFFAAAILVWKQYRTSNKMVVYILRGIGFLALIALAVIYRGENGEHITPRWWGILGLIGWAYLYSCILYQLLLGNKYLLALMIAICVAFYAIGAVVQQSALLHWISAQKGNAAHTSIVLCGVVVTLIFFDKGKEAPDRIRFLSGFIFTTMLFVAGYFLRPWFKISKIHATPTWCLYSAGFCTLLFMFLYWLIDKKGIQKWTHFFKPAATNPLLTYIIPDIIYFLTALLGISLFPDHLRYGWPGTLWSAFFAIAVMGLVIVLNKMKLKLQL
jgi:heparan-alpha-glucosaminide N-acetyltransferase